MREKEQAGETVIVVDCVSSDYGNGLLGFKSRNNGLSQGVSCASGDPARHTGRLSRSKSTGLFIMSHCK